MIGSILDRELGQQTKISLQFPITSFFRFPKNSPPNSADGATGTPLKGQSLAWYKRFRFIDEVSNRSEIVGVNIVKHFPCGKMATATLPALTGFLLFLIEILGRQSLKGKKHGRSVR